ncbi:uncharacterized protein [Fopius arisanus]|uniref:Uncharacterized protein n=1 Tax=Fopius arisanus TaxID=64838 RepID=A0A9R1U961_9HYME|nr:PREDICTED: uncharacterized protein LOC105271819 [Fopius arisanus]
MDSQSTNTVPRGRGRSFLLPQKNRKRKPEDPDHSSKPVKIVNLTTPRINMEYKKLIKDFGTPETINKHNQNRGIKTVKPNILKRRRTSLTHLTTSAIAAKANTPESSDTEGPMTSYNQHSIDENTEVDEDSDEEDDNNEIDETSESSAVNQPAKIANKKDAENYISTLEFAPVTAGQLLRRNRLGRHANGLVVLVAPSLPWGATTLTLGSLKPRDLSFYFRQSSLVSSVHPN